MGKNDLGGAANVVHEIMDVDPKAHCGVMICANSGLPCGSIGSKQYANLKDLRCRTQEESIIANLLLTQFGNDKKLHQKFIEDSFQGVWGMKDGTSNDTFQGINFCTTEDANSYNEVYTLEKGTLGYVDCTNGKTLDSNKTHPVSLIFADSVNANPTIGNPRGTMKRTLNKKASLDYSFFCACIKTKLRASLDAMVALKNTHAIVGYLSCGIYAPKAYKTGDEDILKDFPKILTEVLNEEVGPQKTPRGCYFKQVVLAGVCIRSRGTAP